MAGEPVDPQRQALLLELREAGVRFVVVGGAAIQTHGVAYRTEDVDVTPDLAEDNLERLAGVLNRLDCHLEIDPARPELAVPLPADYFTAERLSDALTWNLRTRYGKLDLTLRPSGFGEGYPALAAAATVRAVAGTSVEVPVASLHDVEHSKRTAARAKDLAYLEQVGRLQQPADTASRPAPPPAPAQQAPEPRPDGPEPFVVKALGERPSDRRGAVLWDHGASEIRRFRDRWGIADPWSALGDSTADAEQEVERQALERTLKRTRALMDRAARMGRSIDRRR